MSAGNKLFVKILLALIIAIIAFNLIPEEVEDPPPAVVQEAGVINNGQDVTITLRVRIWKDINIEQDKETYTVQGEIYISLENWAYNNNGGVFDKRGVEEYELEDVVAECRKRMKVVVGKMKDYFDWNVTIKNERQEGMVDILKCDSKY